MLITQGLHRLVASLLLCAALLSCTPETTQPTVEAERSVDSAELASWQARAANVTIKRDTGVSRIFMGKQTPTLSSALSMRKPKMISIASRSTTLTRWAVSPKPKAMVNSTAICE